MRKVDAIAGKIYELETLQKVANGWRVNGDTISFTNGVFDLLHEGHIFSLSQAASEAKRLVVAINSDASVKRLKGNDRPLNPQQARALVMASLIMVDAVVLFEQDTPLEIIKALLPDVVVKGGDYTLDQIVGAQEIMANGGRVVINPLVPGISTTGIIARMRQQ